MSEPVSEAKFPASTDFTGNFIRSEVSGPDNGRKSPDPPVGYEQFPTHPNREIFAVQQGNKSGDHGIFRPNQGNCVSAGCDRRCGFLTAWRRIVGWILGPIPKNLS